MYIEVSYPNGLKELVAFTVTDNTGRLCHVGICAFAAVGALPGLPPMTPEGTLYVSIIDRDDDRARLFNRTLQYCLDIGREDLERELKNMIGVDNSRQIICLDTGKVYPDIKTAAIANNINYSSLVKHLGNYGIKSVGGKRYRRIGVDQC